MKVDLGLLKLALPDDDEPMAPVMFIAMGEKDEGQKLSVGPTMAKATSAQFRRTLTVNWSARGQDEEVEAALDRTSKELMARVRGKKVSSEARTAGGLPGLYVEFTHEGQKKSGLRSLCWIGCKDHWLFTLNMTGLDLDKNKKAMNDQMASILSSIAV